MKKYIIAICIIVILIVLCIGGYFIYKNMNTRTSPEILKAKANQEIKQLDSIIVSMLNDFNHISYTNYQLKENTISLPNKSENELSSASDSSSGGQGGDSNSKSSQNSNNNSSNEMIENISIIPNSILTNQNKKIDWDTLKQEAELMYGTWPAVLIDLTSLKVNGNQLLQYSSTLDKLVIALEDENKKDAMINLSDLYSLLNEYTKQYSNDNTTINLYQTKAYIIKAYALAEDDSKWNEIKENISKAKNEYTNIVNNIQNTNNMSTINKVYILLNELEKNTNDKNKNIFYINYKNVMQELETSI